MAGEGIYKCNEYTIGFRTDATKIKFDILDLLSKVKVSF